MKKTIIILVFAVICLPAFVKAQPGFYNIVKITNGDLAFLKGQTELNLVFDYQDMKVGEMNENDYVERKVNEMNKVKSESGNEWKTKWFGDRTSRYEPTFEKHFNKNLLKANINCSQSNANAKYTLIIKTVVTEPGLYTGISYAEKNTFISVYAIFVEKDNPSKELCRIYAEKIVGEVPNSFMNYDIGLRITNAYQNLGIRLSKFIVNQLKKIK